MNYVYNHVVSVLSVRNVLCTGAGYFPIICVLRSCIQVEDKLHPMVASLPNYSRPVLPMQLLLEPLRKRFKFHFYGNKQTNSLDKVVRVVISGHLTSLLIGAFSMSLIIDLK